MPPRANTQWLPFRHRQTLAAIEDTIQASLYSIVRPRSHQQADESQSFIELFRFVRLQWIHHDRAPWFVQREIALEILEMGFPFSPWTSPTIHEVGDALEVFVRRDANTLLRVTMGPALHSWGGGPYRRRRGSESSTDT